MPRVNCLLVGSCYAAISFTTVKMKLTFKKGHQEGLARCGCSSPIRYSRAALYCNQWAFISQSSFCARCICFAMPFVGFRAVGFCWCRSVLDVRRFWSSATHIGRRPSQRLHLYKRYSLLTWGGNKGFCTIEVISVAGSMLLSILFQ